MAADEDPSTAGPAECRQLPARSGGAPARSGGGASTSDAPGAEVPPSPGRPRGEQPAGNRRHTANRAKRAEETPGESPPLRAGNRRRSVDRAKSRVETPAKPDRHAANSPVDGEETAAAERRAALEIGSARTCD